MTSSELDRQFLIRLLATFKEEAREHVSQLDARHCEFGSADAAVRAAAIETAFREAHSLKAAARAVGRREIERICQSMESVFAFHKRGRGIPGQPLLEALRDAIDAVGDLVAALDNAPTEVDRERAGALARRLEAALGDGSADGTAGPALDGAKGGAFAAQVATETDVTDVADADAARAAGAAAVSQATSTTAWNRAATSGLASSVRLPVARLESLMRQSEEMIGVKLAARAQALRLADTTAARDEWEREWQRARAAVQALGAGRAGAAGPSAGPDRTALEVVLRFLEWNEGHARARAVSLAAIARAAQTHSRDLSSKVDRMLLHVKQSLVIPCATLLEPLPRMVRDLARDQGKHADVELEGSELEIDRRVLDALREPLLHLVRNGIDHGIEKPEQRLATGKPERATLRVVFRQKDGDKAEITVADDGAGIAPARVAGAAVRNRLIPEERAASLGEREAAALIFESGVSTSAIVTELSGRGLGLAIVRERVENLGGTIDVESVAGTGTCFRLVVPLTLATFRGVCVEAGQQLFVFPTLGLDRVAAVDPGALGTVENRPVLWVEQTPLPLVRLCDVLELPAVPPRGSDAKRYAMVLGAAGRRIAFEVDAVHGDEEIVVKPLGRYLARVRNVLGATVLGSGRIAPILNIHDLVKSAARATPGRSRSEIAAAVAAPAAPATRILVVEDSITARGLLKNILESGGHVVTTAVDGLDAWATLNLESFDLVVSDVEMPRMNGFDLTARIRADARFARLPVMLLTALESREDRERGVEVGANAYLVKSDFDQRRLIEVVERLT